MSNTKEFDNIAKQADIMFAGLQDVQGSLQQLQWAALNYQSPEMGASLEAMVSTLAARLPLFLRGLLLQAAQGLRSGDLHAAELYVEEARRYSLNLGTVCFAG